MRTAFTSRAGCKLGSVGECSTVVSETFDEASAKLVKFLQRQRQPSTLRWIFREDVTGIRRALFVHPSPPPVNLDLWRQRYECGVRQGRGIQLGVLCFAADCAYCYVWVPEDDRAASQAMLVEGLRLAYACGADDSGVGLSGQRCYCSATFALRKLWCRSRGESPSIRALPSREHFESLRTGSGA